MNIIYYGTGMYLNQEGQTSSEQAGTHFKKTCPSLHKNQNH